MKTAALTLTIILLTLGCALAAKLVFPPAASARATDNSDAVCQTCGKYQLTCLNFGKDEYKCLVFDTRSGGIEEVYELDEDQCKKPTGSNYLFWCR